MRSMLGHGRLAVATLAVSTMAAVSPANGAAQSNAPPEDVARAASPARQRAEELRGQANTLMTDQGKYRRAADLLRQAAALTPAGDGQRVDDLRLAANLLYFSGSLGGAESVMVAAAEAALARGDVEQAANSFLDAGWLASLRKGADDARTFGLRALALSASPLLSDEQRDAIRSRVHLPRATRMSTTAASPDVSQ